MLGYKHDRRSRVLLALLRQLPGRPRPRSKVVYIGVDLGEEAVTTIRRTISLTMFLKMLVEVFTSAFLLNLQNSFTFRQWNVKVQ